MTASPISCALGNLADGEGEEVDEDDAAECERDALAWLLVVELFYDAGAEVILALEFCIVLKMYLMQRGMMPYSSTSPMLPVMVCVLPDPDWP